MNRHTDLKTIFVKYKKMFLHRSPESKPKEKKTLSKSPPLPQQIWEALTWSGWG
jgi:hypothetical protein